MVLVEFIFLGRDGTKYRPALVLSTEIYNKTRREIIIFAITSNTERNLAGETIIKYWKVAGLLYPSTVTAIIQTIKSNMVKRKIGELAKSDMENVAENIKKALELK